MHRVVERDRLGQSHSLGAVRQEDRCTSYHKPAYDMHIHNVYTNSDLVGRA